MDAEETEAIALALELCPDLLLIHERLGRRFALQHGMPVAGLLGLVVLAKQRRLIAEISLVIRELQTQGVCRFGPEWLADICRSGGERLGMIPYGPSCCASASLELQFFVPPRTVPHRVAGLEFAGEQALGGRVQELVLDRALR